MFERIGIGMSENYAVALREALACAKMEGCIVTKQTEDDCLRLLRGEIGIDAIVREIVGRGDLGDIQH